MAASKSSVSGWNAALQRLDHLEQTTLQPTVAVYGQICNACSAGERWREAAWLLLAAHRHAVETNAFIYNMGIKTCKDRSWQLGVSLSQLHSTRFQLADVFVASATLSCLSLTSSWRAALLALRCCLLGSLEPTTPVYNTVMSACNLPHQSAWIHGFNLCALMCSLLCDVTRVTILGVLGLASVSGTWLRTMANLDSMLQARVDQGDSRILGACVDCVKNSSWLQVLALLLQGQLRSMRVTAVTYGSVFGAAEQSGQWQQSAQTLEQLQQHGIEQNAVLRSAVLSAALLWHSALHAVKELVTVRIQTSIVHMSCILSARESVGNWRYVACCLDDVKSMALRSDVIGANAAMNTCDKSERWDEALRLMQELQKIALRASQISLNSAVSSCESSLQWRLAGRLLESSLRRGLQVDLVALVAALMTCNRSEQWCETLLLLTAMHALQHEPDATTRNVALSARLQGGAWSEAVSTLDLLSCKHLELAVTAHSAAVFACGSGSEWSQVVQLLSDLDAAGHEPYVLACSSAIECCERRSQLPQALRLSTVVADVTLKFLLCLRALARDSAKAG
eukprot:TRINITY_DN42501_c0_g1_i1.p1 TRINITY_DN42501_c0_g1~~TRINITY_DN42501_c0_g1_i1.p1  ORF type:complete len:602 (-),score=72.75 TRINITY_DN42501_c0_g1_i1:102-1802(-)